MNFANSASDGAFLASMRGTVGSEPTGSRAYRGPAPATGFPCVAMKMSKTEESASRRSGRVMGVRWFPEGWVSYGIGSEPEAPATALANSPSLTFPAPTPADALSASSDPSPLEAPPHELGRPPCCSQPLPASKPTSLPSRSPLPQYPARRQVFGTH